MTGGDDSATFTVSTRSMAPGAVAAPVTPRRGLAAGDRVGRYRIESLLGSGGMGEVYAALDPDLDRRVALKLMAAERRDDSARRRRLIEEAQAVASLSHPNVVVVYEVGAAEQGLFMAMELVQGQPLSEWLETPRTTAEILGVLIEAGSGLAAAHARGLIHRDVKPSNILVGADRTRLADFGVARLMDAHLDRDGEREPTTEIGTVVGTPRYMSPEQRRGRAIDPRSDQYSFCLTMYEALYGSLPDRLPGEGVEPPRRRGDGESVPARVRRALARGLSARPAGRFSSTDDLVGELCAAIAPRRNRVAWAGAALLAGAAVVAVASATVGRSDVCESVAADSERVWNRQRRAEVRRAAERHPDGAKVARRAIAAIDARVAGWRGARVNACRGTQVRGVQSAGLLERRFACLDSRLRVLDELLGLLAGASTAVIGRADELIEHIPPDQPCADTAALLAVMRPPASPAARQRLDQLAAMLDRARALEIAGDRHRAIAIAREVTRAAGHPPLVARALLLRSRLEHEIDPDAELETLRQAIVEAGRAGDHRVAVRAWLRLVAVTAERVGHRQARALELGMQGAVARARDPADLRAAMERVRALVRLRARDPSAAAEHARRAHALASAEELDSEARAMQMQLARGLSEAGHVDVAWRLAEQVAATLRRRYGGDHPRTREAAASLAHYRRKAGEPRD